MPLFDYFHIPIIPRNIKSTSNRQWSFSLRLRFAPTIRESRMVRFALVAASFTDEIGSPPSQRYEARVNFLHFVHHNRGNRLVIHIEHHEGLSLRDRVAHPPSFQ